MGNGRKMFLFVCVLAVFVYSSAGVSAALLLEEDFEASSLLATKWNNHGGVLTTSPVAAEGTQSIGIDAAGEYFRTWSSGTTTSVIGMGTELWMEYYQYVGTDTGNNGSYVGPRSPDGDIAIDLRVVGSGAGTGTYDLITFDGRSGFYATVESGLAINTWERLLFGVNMTNPAAGDGVYSIYREVAGDWQPLIEEAAYNGFSAFSNYPYFLKVQFGTNNTSLNFDDVRIYDSNPIPEPTSMFILGMGSCFVFIRKRVFHG